MVIFVIIILCVTTLTFQKILSSDMFLTIIMTIIGFKIGQYGNKKD